MKKRLIELDALRGIAALLVLLYHYFTRYNSLYGHDNFLETNYFSYGNQGVQLFFMISGFVIFLTLNHIKKPMDFVISRFSRLYPPFWIAIASTFLIVYLFGLPGRQVSFLTALKNMIMFHEYFEIPNVDGVYWTLRVELTFYLWMFIAYLLNALKRIEIFILIFILFNLLINMTNTYIHPQLENFLLFKYLPFFGIGICLYKIFYNEKSKLTVVTLLIALISTSYLSTPKLSILYVFFTIIFFLGIKGKILILSNKILIFFGAISYSLYLLHQNIGYVIINEGYNLGLNPFASISIAIIISIIISYVSYKFVEKPSAKLIKKHYNNLTLTNSLIKIKRNENNV